MFILTSQDGLSTGVLGVNSIMQVIPTPSFSEGGVSEYGIYVNGVPYGKFETSVAATSVIEEVKTSLALILSQGENADVEPQYQIPADKDGGTNG